LKIAQREKECGQPENQEVSRRLIKQRQHDHVSVAKCTHHLAVLADMEENPSRSFYRNAVVSKTTKTTDHQKQAMKTHEIPPPTLTFLSLPPCKLLKVVLEALILLHVAWVQILPDVS
jgi:hypothetical protein